MVSSYVGENKEFERQYLSGELEVELTPQGTLAERLRAGGCGIPAFYTVTGAGTQVAEGGLPWLYAADGTVAKASPPKEVKVFEVDGRREGVRPRAGDRRRLRAGPRRGRATGTATSSSTSRARNFNPLAAMAGRVTIAEVEELVEPGELDPDQVHLPGIYVHRVLPLTADQAKEKRIERRTVRPAAPPHADTRASPDQQPGGLRWH